MANAKMTSNGRTTLPKEIRDKLGLKAGDRLNFALTPNRTVLIKVASHQEKIKKLR